ncbi:MAG TPA: helix-turn-helix domain-containing protein [Chryseolinea sp.]|nr:helix-turn-helix domain-containing protein [Chryseolinea sp.]
MTQSVAIRKYLESGRSLTPLSALRLFGTMKLASRCSELISSGLSISKEMVEVKTRQGKTRVMKYWISKK